MRSIPSVVVLAVALFSGSSAWAHATTAEMLTSARSETAQQATAHTQPAAGSSENNKAALANHYAAREAKAKHLENFQGGSTTVVISTSTIIIVLLIVLILVLI